MKEYIRRKLLWLASLLTDNDAAIAESIKFAEDMKQFFVNLPEPDKGIIATNHFILIQKLRCLKEKYEGGGYF